MTDNGSSAATCASLPAGGGARGAEQNKKNSAGSSGRQAQESQQARAPKTLAFALRGVFAPSDGRRGKTRPQAGCCYAP